MVDVIITVVHMLLDNVKYQINNSAKIQCVHRIVIEDINNAALKIYTGI